MGGEGARSGSDRSDTGANLAPTRDYLEVHPRRSFGLGLVLSAMLQKYRERSLLALALLTAQAFLFNAVFFSYGLVLTNFHGVPEHTTGALSGAARSEQLLGAHPAGIVVDNVGRRKMITGTYAVAGVLLLATRDPIQSRRIYGVDADDSLDADFLFCLGRGEFSLSYSQ